MAKPHRQKEVPHPRRPTICLYAQCWLRQIALLGLVSRKVNAPPWGVYLSSLDLDMNHQSLHVRCSATLLLGRLAGRLAGLVSGLAWYRVGGLPNLPVDRTSSWLTGFCSTWASSARVSYLLLRLPSIHIHLLLSTHPDS